MALPPPAPGYIAPPTFQVALDWTEEEQRALEAGLQRYPPEAFDLVQRYVKIAAMLPRKSVRDVALRARWTVNQQLLKKRKPGELPPGAAAAGAKKPLGAPGGLLPPKAPQIPPVPMVRPGERGGVWRNEGRFQEGGVAREADKYAYMHGIRETGRRGEDRLAADAEGRGALRW